MGLKFFWLPKPFVENDFWSKIYGYKCFLVYKNFGSKNLFFIDTLLSKPDCNKQYLGLEAKIDKSKLLKLQKKNDL